MEFCQSTPPLTTVAERARRGIKAYLHRSLVLESLSFFAHAIGTNSTYLLCCEQVAIRLVTAVSRSGGNKMAGLEQV